MDMESALNLSGPLEYKAFRVHTSTGTLRQPCHPHKPFILFPVQKVLHPGLSAKAGIQGHPRSNSHRREAAGQESRTCLSLLILPAALPSRESYLQDATKAQLA